ncbi:O-antigen ligase family protein, partial [Bacteroidales bacterium OttesenSCG-928-C03]|nr:O-antigen ligase family protein [Bacteroidales bacterium OttesenSCG-928-C03]
MKNNLYLREEKINRTDIHSAVFFALMTLIIAVQPFTFYLNLPIAIALLINWIAEWDWKAKRQRIDTPQKKVLFCVFLSIFAIYMIGIFYSTNTQRALAELEYKLWFLVAPLTIFTAPPERLNNKKILFLARIFLISLLLLILTNFSIAVWKCIEAPRYYYFVYIHLSNFMHPAYSAMHVSTGLIVAFHLFLHQNKQRQWRFLTTISMIVFPIYIFLLQSKAGLLALLILFILMSLYLINRRKRRLLPSLVFVSLLILIPTTLFFVVPEPYNRLKPAVRQLVSDDRDKDASDGTGLRLAVWQASWKVAMQHPLFGVGPGDVRDELMKEYEKSDNIHLTEHQFNCHNQYLQTFVGLGLAGLLVLLCYFCIPLGYAIRHKKITYILFLLLILINLFSESMFERKAGGDF